MKKTRVNNTISHPHRRPTSEAGFELRSYQTKDHQKHLICQFLYNIGGEMHFYQENSEKNLLKRHHSPQNHQSKGCTAGNINFYIPCFTILILRNKLDLVHLKVMSNINRISNNPNMDILKQAGGSV